MTIHLNAPISHPNDNDVRVDNIGINYPSGRVVIRVTLLQTGEQRDFYVGSQPGDIDTIAGLTASVQNFAGLRNAIEVYLGIKAPGLAGTVS